MRAVPHRVSHRAVTMLALIALAGAAGACSGGEAAMMRRHEAQMVLAERSGMAMPAAGGAAAGAAAPPSAGGGGAAAAGDPVKLGLTVAGKYGCTACHSATGAAGVGPTWKGLAGAKVDLVDGSSTTANDAFLKESITNPNAKIVKGFAPGIMPQEIVKQMKPEEIDQVIAYIKSLK